MPSATPLEWPKSSSDVEAEQQDVAVLHDVLLALHPHPAGLLRPPLAAVRREIWRAQGLLTSVQTPTSPKLRPSLRDAIMHALCHAA